MNEQRRREQERGPTVLVIDDVAPILRILELELSIHGYNVVAVAITEQVYDLVDEIQPDVVVMEVLLPQMCGMELLRGIRQRSKVPVVFLTTSNNEADREEAIAFGASDYILKPFAPDELTHRISSVIKAKPPANRVMRAGTVRIDFSHRRAYREDREITPSSSEWAILFALGRAARDYVSAEDILLQVWGLEGVLNRDSLVDWMDKLRAKLGDDSDSPSIVLGSAEKGYMLDMVPDEDSE